MSFEIYEPSLVIVYEDFQLPFSSQVFAAAEYGQLLKEGIVDKSWDIKDTQVVGPIQRMTSFKNGVSLDVTINRILVKQDRYFSDTQPAPDVNLIDVTNKFLKIFPEQGKIAVGINFKGIIETDKAAEEISLLFFDKAQKKIPEYVLKGAVRLVIDQPDSQLKLTIDYGDVVPDRSSSVPQKRGVLIDANYHFEGKQRNHTEVVSLLANQTSKMKNLHETISKIFS